MAELLNKAFARSLRWGLIILTLKIRALLWTGMFLTLPPGLLYRTCVSSPDPVGVMEDMKIAPAD